MGGQPAHEVAERVRAIATPIVLAMGLDLVEVTCSGQGARTIVRVFIDKAGGVQVGDCEQVHQSLGHALDVEDPIPHSYTLEVSSPGLDRPFRTSGDYERARDHRVRIKLRSPLDGQYRLVGRLMAVEEAGIQMRIREGRTERTTRLSWEQIAEARREVEF